MFEKDKMLVIEAHRDSFIAFAARRALAKLRAEDPELPGVIQQDAYICSQGATILFRESLDNSIAADLTWNELSMSKEDFESYVQSLKQKKDNEIQARKKEEALQSLESRRKSYEKLRREFE